MLLNFRVSNFRSFREEAVISFLATRLDTNAGVPAIITADQKTVDVLPVVAILGANASGKSNLLRAINTMSLIVANSATRAPYMHLEREPFLLDRACIREPTMFEVDFTIEGERYQYGFELGENEVVGEWLYTFPYKRAQTLFDRDQKDYTFGKKLGGQNKLLTEITRKNVLFLSVGAQAGHPLLSRIYEWFVHQLSFLDVPSRSEASPALIKRLSHRHKKAMQLMSMADLGIVDAKIEKVVPDTFTEEDYRKAFMQAMPEEWTNEVKEEEFKRAFDSFAESEELQLVHRANRGGISLPFEEESLGTKSWMAFVTYALDALESGGVLLVDELDASLHPLLMARAIDLFRDSKSNPFGAQLIFTTHDTTILGGTGNTLKLSRGQIWLVEKSDFGASTLIPLSDFRPRKNENLENGYLQGRYGGTPRIAPTGVKVGGAING